VNSGLERTSDASVAVVHPLLKSVSKLPATALGQVAWDLRKAIHRLERSHHRRHDGQSNKLKLEMH